MNVYLDASTWRVKPNRHHDDNPSSRSGVMPTGVPVTGIVGSGEEAVRPFPSSACSLSKESDR